MNSEKLQNLILNAIERKKISQRELAKLTGISRSTLNDIVNGKIKKIKLDDLYQISISLELNLLLPKELSKDEKVHLQAKLNAQQRKENIKDAFFIAEKFKENLQNSQIFLLDDVVTTGSTANEAAKILKANGASKVHIFSLARRL